VNPMYIVALGRIEEDVLTVIEQGLGRVYGVDVKQLPGLPDPDYAYDVQRGQHSSAHILRQLIARLPADAACVLGITQRDLFIPMLSFVLGQAQLGGPAAVVSLARLHQEFYGLPPDRHLVLMRAVKEAVHEVGHTVGLTHCADSSCPMSLSNTVRHVDAKGAALCASCLIIVEEQTKHVRFVGPESQGAGTRRV
jgi:archaemetzincin